jgi:ABC-type branched-subunit amino acid transport system ATPase component
MEMCESKRKGDYFHSEGVVVNFGGLRALNNVSLTVGENEIRGLIGPNGAGKSTFFNVATGYVKASSGGTFFEGENISGLKPHEVAKRGIIRTFQKRGILPGLTVLENVLIGYHRLLPEMKLWHIGLRLKRFKSLEKKAIVEALEVIESVGLRDVSDQLARDLSFGQQTLVEIARALVSRPKLLMLDEPAAGLSSSEREHVSRLLKRLARSHGVSLIISDHVMDFVMDVCENLSVLNFGEILAEGPADYIRQHPRVLEAYIGTG